MGEYHPYAGTNAIQEVIFGIQFQGDIPQSDLSNARRVAEANLKEDFPRSEDIIGTQFRFEKTDKGNIQLEGTDASYQSGFNLLSSSESDGTPSRVLQMSRNLFSLHFMNYVGWEGTLSDSLRYIGTIFPRINLEKNGLQSFSLRYIDRFIFDGPTEEACASLLFNQPSKFISSKCFEAGPYWHCHSGWFDEDSEYSRILNQLNIGSAMVDSSPTITVDHNIIFHMRRPFNTVKGFIQSAGGKNVGLQQSLDDLHTKNSEVITEILCVDMAQRIGLLQ